MQPDEDSGKPVQCAERVTYDATSFEPLFRSEEGHFWFRSRNRCIAAAVRTLAGFERFQNVLEIGCGTGVVLQELRRILPNSCIVGVELHAEGLKYARKRFGGPLVQADIRRSPFRRPFDLIGLFDVLEHLEDDAGILRHVRTLLRPGGTLLLTVPGHPCLWSYFDDAACHCRRYSSSALHDALREGGFEVEYMTQFQSILFPILWLKRKLTDVRHPRMDAQQTRAVVESDLRIHPALNWILDLLLRPEAGLIARRLTNPIGTSFLAIATRPQGG